MLNIILKYSVSYQSEMLVQENIYRSFIFNNWKVSSGLKLWSTE